MYILFDIGDSCRNITVKKIWGESYGSHERDALYHSWKSLSHPIFDNRYFQEQNLSAQFMSDVKWKIP